jgi:hypothetical protein
MYSYIRNRLVHPPRSTMIIYLHSSDYRKSSRVSHCCINKIQHPPRVQITVSPERMQNSVTPPRVVHHTVTHVTVPKSHRRLQSTPCRAITPSTPHPIVMRSAAPQNLSSDMLAETVQTENHVLVLPTGTAIKTAKRANKNTPVIIMPEIDNAVICPDTGKSLKHQELITLLRNKIGWIRSNANEVGRLVQGLKHGTKGTNTIIFISKSDVPACCKVTVLHS